MEKKRLQKIKKKWSELPNDDVYQAVENIEEYEIDVRQIIIDEAKLRERTDALKSAINNKEQDDNQYKWGLPSTSKGHIINVLGTIFILISLTFLIYTFHTYFKNKPVKYFPVGLAGSPLFLTYDKNPELFESEELLSNPFLGPRIRETNEKHKKALKIWKTKICFLFISFIIFGGLGVALIRKSKCNHEK